MSGIDIVGSRMPSLASDELKQPRKGYGQGGSSFPSSIRTTERTDTKIQAMRDDTGVIDTVAVHGSRTVRPTNAGTLSDRHAGHAPIHSGTKGAATGPKVPDKLGTAEGRSVRQP